MNTKKLKNNNEIEKNAQQKHFLHSTFYILHSTRASRDGFVLLFAIIAVSIILSITMGMLAVSYKQVTLTTSARDSNYAFNAADTGVECGLYYDQSTSPDTNGSKALLAGPGTDSVDIVCDGTNTATGSPAEGDGSVTYSFVSNSLSNDGALEVEVPGDKVPSFYCAKVTIVKHAKTGDNYPPPHEDIPIIETRIDSYGYNVPCDNLTPNNRRVIERHLSAIYQENVPQ